MQDDFYEPIYKGCTAPALMFGVPLLPFILGALVIGQLSILSFYFIRFSAAMVFIVIGVFMYLWARQVSKNDEHRLLQYLMKARMRGRQSRSRKYWGAISFSPIPPRK